MVNCPACGHSFVCTEHTAKVGKVVQDCPLRKGAIWAQVKHDGGGEVPGVYISVGGVPGSMKTDTLGYAPFDPLDAKVYQLSLAALRDGLEDRYEPPEEEPRPVEVKNGKIASPLFVLKRRAWLKIKLVLRGSKNPRKFQSAEITVKDLRSESSAADTGIADFGWLSVKGYSASAVLGRDDAEELVTLKEWTDFPLEPRDDDAASEVPLEVVPLNIVTAHVEMTEKILIIDHEPEVFEAVGRWITLSLKQTNPEHPYSKGLKLTCQPAFDLEAYFDEACSVDQQLVGDLATGAPLPEPQRKDLCTGNAVRVFVRGKAKVGKAKIALVPEDPADRLVKLGEAPTPVDAQIQIWARPQVQVEWLHGGGVEKVKVALQAGSGAKHALPETPAHGLSKWLGTGIEPGPHDCTFEFPGGIAYLLHDGEGRPIDEAKIDLQPGGPPVTFKIKQAEVKFDIKCDTGGKIEGLDAEVKVKLVDTAVKLRKGAGVVTVPIPVIALNQACEIETLTPDGGDVYEMVGIDPT